MHRLANTCILATVVLGLTALPALAAPGRLAKAQAEAAATLERDLSGLTGYARAEKLLAFAGANPAHPRTPAALEEAKGLLSALVTGAEADLKAAKEAQAKAEGELAAARQELAGAQQAAKEHEAADAGLQDQLKIARERLAEAQTALDRARNDPLLPAVSAVFLAKDEPERKAALQALAAFGDERAVPALGYVARRDRVAGVRAQAARDLGGFLTPQAEGFATEIVNDSSERDEVRAAAALALGAQKTQPAGDLLAAVARDTDNPVAVRQAAVDALRANYPGVVERMGLGAKVADVSGRPIFAGVGAASTGYSLALVGALSPNAGPGTIIGALGGVVIGGVGAYLLGGNNIDTGKALFMGSAAVWSVPVGWQLAALSGGPDASCSEEFSGDLRKACPAIALGTHVAALTASWLLKDRLQLTPLDNLELNVAALAGMFTTLGITLLPEPTSEERPAYALMAAGPLVGFALGTYFAPKLRLTFPLAWLTMLAAGQGAWTGGFLGAGTIPEFVTGPLGSEQYNPQRDERMAGLALLGTGLGLGAMLGASAGWQPSGSDATILTFALLGGDLLGGGLPVLVAGDDGANGSKIGTAVGGLLTATAAGLLTKPLGLKFGGGDSLLVGVGTALAAWQGFGWAAYSEMTSQGNPTLRTTPGVGLTVTGLATLGLVGLAQRTDLSGWHAGWMYSGAIWGGWLAFWTSYIFDARGENQLAAALAGTDAGLITSVLLLSPLVDISPNTVAWVSVFGIGGSTIASLATTFFFLQGPGHEIATANVIGSVAGMILGGVLSPYLPGGKSREGPKSAGLDGFHLPQIAPMPVVDSRGRADGIGAQLVWAL